MQQTFSYDGRRHARLGFIALLNLDQAANGSVLRHESTLRTPREDRAHLLNTVPANLSPIFMVYPDAGGRMHAILSALTDRSPIAEVTSHREAVRVWAIPEEALTQAVAQGLASCAVLIADGHHRFEVAYANRSRYAKVMVYLVSMADPSLIVGPIHRVVTSHQPARRRVLRELCSFEPAADLSAVLKWLKEQSGDGCFGCVEAGAFSTVRLKADALHARLRPSREAPAARSDVSMLHELILPSLGVSPDQIQYLAHPQKALEAARAGQGTMVWLLRPLGIQRIYELARQGVTLPPKSTYFFPKVPSGLVFNVFG